MAGGNKGNGLQVKIKGNILSHQVYVTGGAYGAIYRGTMVNINDAGFALQAADLASATFAGIAEESIAAKASGATQATAPFVRVRRRGIFKMTLDATSKAAAPTLVGDLVYVNTAQSATVDELVGLAAQCTTGYVLVGKIVKHGTDAEAAAGTSSAIVWVDILGVAHTTLGDATYTTIANLVSVDAAKGAKLVGYDDGGNNYTATDVADALDEIATKLTEQEVIRLPLFSFLNRGAGTLAALAIFADGTSPTPGFVLEGTEECGVRWNNHATPDQIITQFAKPLDMDTTANMVLHILAVKSAAGGDTPVFTVAAYEALVGAALGADVDFGVESTAMVDNTNIQELTSTMLATNLSTTMGAIALSFGPKDGTLGTDDVTVLAAWIEYTKLMAAST